MNYPQYTKEVMFVDSNIIDRADNFLFLFIEIFPLYHQAQTPFLIKQLSPQIFQFVHHHFHQRRP